MCEMHYFEETGGKGGKEWYQAEYFILVIAYFVCFACLLPNCNKLFSFKKAKKRPETKKPHTHTHRVFRQSANRHEIKRNNVYICDVHKAFSRTWMSECESARLKWGDMLSLICSAERMKRCSCRRVYSPQNGTNFGAAGSSRNVRELFLLGGFFRIRQKPFFISSSVVCVFHAVENASEWMSTKEAGHSKTLYLLWCVCERVQLFMASEFSLWRGGVVINIIAVDEHLFGSLAPLSFGYEMQSKCECWCGVEWKSES